MERLSHTEFSRQMNTVFMVQASGASVGLSLLEARDETAGGQRVAPGSECFSLVFRGPVDRPLDQDTYHVEHPRMGAFDLFIVPAWADDGGCYYQAVFNRLPAR